MRFLMLIVLVPLLFGLMFFTVSNANTTVSVALPWNTYPTVSLLTVVSYSIGLGVVVTAIAEGRVEGQGEWDPPGGWRRFALCLETGADVGR